MIAISAHAFGQCWVPAKFDRHDGLQTVAGEVARTVAVRIEFEPGIEEASRRALDVKALLKLKGYSNIRVQPRKPQEGQL